MISTNQIHTVVQSNGTLSWDGTEGQFSVKDPNSHPDTSFLNNVGLLLVGLDFFGNLHLAAQTNKAPGNQDYQPGLLDPVLAEHLDLNKIWRVTREDIEIHMEDLNTDRIY